MEKLTVNINGMALEIIRDDDFYVISSGENRFEVDAPQEGMDLLNSLIVIQKKAEENSAKENLTTKVK